MYWRELDEKMSLQVSAADGLIKEQQRIKADTDLQNSD